MEYVTAAAAFADEMVIGAILLGLAAYAVLKIKGRKKTKNTGGGGGGRGPKPPIQPK